MNKHIAPLPANEQQRVIELSSFDMDISHLDESLKDLSLLAAKVAGTDISHISLVDSLTNWAFACHGFDGGPSPREDSVCQYTIAGDQPFFEVPDMLLDERFRDRAYVTGDPHFRYYLGVPLQTKTGSKLGALCVLHKAEKKLSPEKVDLLHIIAREVMSRLNTMKLILELQKRIKVSDESQRKVAHDIRGPLGGIIGLTQIINEQGVESDMTEVLEFVDMISKSSHSLLGLAEEILTTDKMRFATHEAEPYFTLDSFKEKLETLYVPLALNKGVKLAVSISSGKKTENFSRSKLMQIAGNLITNAIKFTHAQGTVNVDLALVPARLQNILRITVADTGIGLEADAISRIMDGSATTSNGTNGERGFGFGLPLVKHLVEEMGGTLQLSSEPGNGARFEVQLKLERIF
jgi:signal transduction histidine kinase